MRRAVGYEKSTRRTRGVTVGANEPDPLHDAARCSSAVLQRSVRHAVRTRWGRLQTGVLTPVCPAPNQEASSRLHAELCDSPVLTPFDRLAGPLSPTVPAQILLIEARGSSRPPILENCLEKLGAGSLRHFPKLMSG